MALGMGKVSTRQRETRFDPTHAPPKYSRGHSLLRQDLPRSDKEKYRRSVNPLQEFPSPSSCGLDFLRIALSKPQ